MFYNCCSSFIFFLLFFFRKNMGQDESLPSNANDERGPYISSNENIININEANISDLSSIVKNPIKIHHINVVRSKIKKYMDLPNLSAFCYNSSKLESIPSQIIHMLMNSTRLESIDFSFNEITSVPKDLLKIPTLKHVSLFQNNIKTIDLSDVNFGIADFGMNNLTSIPKISNSIKFISLDHNKIQTIDVSFDSIQKMSLRNNIITTIKPNISFHGLRIIDLSYNQITVLPNLRDVFPIVRHLDLSHNQIEILPEFPFQIEEFSISCNKIKEIPGSFSSLIYIKSANFSDNQIEKVPQLPETIQTLIIHNNKITKFTESKTPKLTSLLIRQNNLHKIPKLHESKIGEISLASNFLTSIKIDSILKNVSTLDLSDNRLTEIPKVIFTIERLRFFSAARNYLKTIPEEVYDTQLVSLNLSQNPIESLPKIPITLERLILNHCSLNKADFYDEDNEELIELYLAGNSLSKITFLPWFQTVILSRNAFKEFPQINNQLKYLDLSCNLLRDIPLIKSKTLVHLDLSCNYLLNVQINAPKLKQLKINHNPNLQANFDLKDFPALQQIEFVDTNNVKFTNYSNIPHIELSNGGQDKKEILFRAPKKSAIYTCIQGDNSSSEDVCTVIQNIRDGVHMMCMFDGSSTHKSPVYAARATISTFNKSNEMYNKQPLHIMCNKVAATVNEQKYFDMREMCFAFIEKSKIFIEVMGSMVCFIISNDGKIRQTLKAEELELYGPSSVSSVVSSAIVFNQPRKVFNYESPIESTDKWVLLVSSSVASNMPINVIEIIASRAHEVSDFAYDLRNLAFSYNQSNNVSICLLNIQMIQASN